MKIWVGGKFTEDPLHIYVGGTYVLGGWKDCTEMSYKDIVVKCKEEGYGELSKLGYYKPRGDWDYQT